jgi:predicted metal-dependent hydrolase
MDSAVAVRDQIDDPVLLDELAEFLRQEGHHSFQHQKFNRMIGELGFDIERYEGRFERALQWAADNLHPMQRLAVTVALEHFTASLSSEWLSNAELSKDADPNVNALWAWHFAEEIEHKATCFDLYERLHGRQRTRVRALRRAWFLILAITLRNVLSMLREDGRLLQLPDHLRGLWYLFGPRGMLTRMVPSLLAYSRPDFHPWQANDAPLIADWQRANSQYIKKRGAEPSASS